MSTPPAPPPGTGPGARSDEPPPGGWPQPGYTAYYPDGSYAYTSPDGRHTTVYATPGPGPLPPPGYPVPTPPFTDHGYQQPYAPPVYASAPYYPPDPSAPYGYNAHGQPYSEKTKLVAGLLQILIGGLGIGRFYTGHVGIGIAQIAVTLVTCGIGSLWGLIDGILILVNGGTDAQGRPLREG